ncbi:hypothetical protein [Leptospira perolatii]|uniref:hypothetical protein n=1 Tax=Leptospira perolatii TaxID=2023191 RepID=UPI000F63C637|nr:hypothetical protein [Leptospira perolatii]
MRAILANPEPVTVNLKFSVRVNVTGLVGGGLVIENNATDTISVGGNGTVSFATKISQGKPYLVTVKQNPTGPLQTCSVNNASGLIPGSDVTNVTVVCSTNGYFVGGTVTGLAGSGLVIRNNGSNSTTISADGSFSFSTKIADGANYNVTVSTNPSSPTQVCSVTNYNGTISGADVSNVTISCSTSSFTVGGSISGLSGTGLVLENNGGDALSISSNGSFTFSTSVVSGNTYSVTIQHNPSTPTQVCSITNGSGTITSSAISNVSISCSTSSFTVGGSVSGLIGSGLVLKNNGGNSLSISGDGTFTFSTSILSGNTYDVTIGTSPSSPIQNCTITNGSGTVTSGSITNVSISCGAALYNVGGIIYGLTGNLVLSNNGSDQSTISVPGNFKMNTPVANGSAYSISVQTQPAGQTCYISMPFGSVSAADVSNITINCINGVVTSPLINGTIYTSSLSITPYAENPSVGPAFGMPYAGTTGGTMVDGVGNSAVFLDLFHITTDGIYLYVVDNSNNIGGAVRKIHIATRTVTSLFPTSKPKGITTDGVFLFVSTHDQVIIKYNLATGTYTTIAGAAGLGGNTDGAGLSARFLQPRGVATDGSNLYIADSSNHVIRKINLVDNSVSTIAGDGTAGTLDGTGTSTKFNSPRHLTYLNNTLYVANTSAHNIRKIDLTTSPVTVTTIAGSTTGVLGNVDDPTGTNALFNKPSAITFDSNYLYIVDSTAAIKKISQTAPYAVTTILGCSGAAGVGGVVGGTADQAPIHTCNSGEASFQNPVGITTDGTSLFVTDLNSPQYVRKID